MIFNINIYTKFISIILKIIKFSIILKIFIILLILNYKFKGFQIYNFATFEKN